MNNFLERYERGELFELRLVEIFRAFGFESDRYSSESALENATTGDGWVSINSSSRIVSWEAKFAYNISLKSIKRFTGMFFIICPYCTGNPKFTNADKIFVVPSISLKSYATYLENVNKTIKMKSGDIGIQLNLGQWNSSFVFGKKVTLEKFIYDDLVFLENDV